MVYTELSVALVSDARSESRRCNLSQGRYQADYDNEKAARADFNDHKDELLPNHKIELLHLVDSEGFEVLDSFEQGIEKTIEYIKNKIK